MSSVRTSWWFESHFAGFMILMYIFETYLDLRQHAAHELTTLPKPLLGVVSKEKFDKARAYSLDKRWVFFPFLRARVTSVHVYFLFRFVFYVCACQSCFLTFSFEIVVTWSITLIERSFNRCVLCFLTALINHSSLLHLSATSTLFMRLLPYSWTPWFCSLACYLGFGRWVIEHHVGFVSPIVLENNLLCWFLPTEIWRRCVVHGL